MLPLVWRIGSCEGQRTAKALLDPPGKMKYFKSKTFQKEFPSSHLSISILIDELLELSSPFLDAVAEKKLLVISAGAVGVGELVRGKQIVPVAVEMSQNVLDKV